MPFLERSLRNQLERTVKDARDIAEAAAKAALEQLGVGDAKPAGHLSKADAELRRKLRAHGRQLGDTRNSKTEAQEIERLIEEVAYEHWHRMLFARFLAENDLLMYWDDDDRDNPIPVGLESCQNLIDEGSVKARNKWELAGRLATRMLPQIFRTDSPVFQLDLPPEHEQKLEKLVADLPQTVFTASDSIGWVYQFWQAKKKDEINASEVKIGARELPAVTQLFTEPYMVSFLLDNSLGAWWAARKLTQADLKNAKSEDELRKKAALPGVSLEYLRFIKKEDGTWAPAAGTFDGWPEHLKDLKTLDPCCGSGHFLVAAFLMLVPMRIEMEKLTVRDAVDAVLRENIHGLEIDQRCVELAAFSLAFAAWRYSNAGGYRPLQGVNVACSGLVITEKLEEWLTLGGKNTNLRLTLEALYKQFIDAPVLGSLINPEASLGKSPLYKLKWEEVAPLLTKAMSIDGNSERSEMGVVAQGLSKAANILAAKYQWIITNVPYLSRAKQNSFLSEFTQNNYPESKNDIATVFLDRYLDVCTIGGAIGFVIPQNWLFLKNYQTFRKRLLSKYRWNMLARLGSGAFDTITGEVVKAILISLTRESPDKSHPLRGIDVAKEKGVLDKATGLIANEVQEVIQGAQVNNPGCTIALENISSDNYLREFALSYAGVCTGDYPRFGRNYWEIEKRTTIWEFQRSTVTTTSLWGGMENVLRWEEGKGELYRFVCDRLGEKNVGSWLRGHDAWRKKGVLVKLMSSLPISVYSGELFDDNVAVLIPKDDDNLLPLVTYCESEQFSLDVRKVNDKHAVKTQYLLQVPFDLTYWSKIAEEKYPNGLPEPYSDCPTQWIFHGHPASGKNPLQVAIARLVGYQWPAELDNTMELSGDARAFVKKSGALLEHADKDGIVCIPPVRGEASAADRLLNLLAAAYGDVWNIDKLSELLTNVDHSGKSLDSWLREKFFAQHCKLFQHRPFIWHIWDGLQDGFSALVNYHKLDRKNLEALIYTYLGDWINRQKQDKAKEVDGADEKLAAAEILKKRLELILTGEDPYDIFVRWKPIEKQPIGWEPDINDGVRMNIRPFMSVPDVGKKGAGLLRDKPNIDWKKDRGKDVESAPWYHVFKGDRINDHHLKIADKKKSRGGRS